MITIFNILQEREQIFSTANCCFQRFPSTLSLCLETDITLPICTTLTLYSAYKNYHEQKKYIKDKSFYENTYLCSA